MEGGCGKVLDAGLNRVKPGTSQGGSKGGGGGGVGVLGERAHRCRETQTSDVKGKEDKEKLSLDAGLSQPGPG